MKVALDATPLLGEPTGVGRYVEQLILALAADPADVQQVLVPVTWRGAGGLTRGGAATAPGVRVGTRRAPARPLREAWARVAFPPAEWLSGRVDVWHGTNFVLPPPRRAAGVVTVHDLTYLRYPLWVQPAVRRYRVLVPVALRRAGAVCTPSEAVRAELLEAYPWVPAERVIATPNAVDPRIAGWDLDAPPAAGRKVNSRVMAAEEAAVAGQPAEVDEALTANLAATGQPDHDEEAASQAHHRASSGLAPPGLPDHYVLFLGTQEPRKGLDTLLAAYRLLVAEHLDPPPLVVAGPTGWGLRLAVSGLPAGLVRAIGYLPAGQVPTVLRGAAALAFPSRYEGFGLPPLEALACGVPVVASDLPVLREVLGEQASYAAVADAEAFAAALAGVLNDPGDRATRERRRAHALGFTRARLATAALRAYQIACTPT